MTPPRHIAVIDIGKTNAKLALVDLTRLTEIAVVTRPNRVIPGPPYPHYDVEGHWAFLCDALAGFHRDHRIDAISVTTHGACAALLDDSGDLAAPILDYEHTYPDATNAAYDRIRPAFAQTGSPRLPGGLNIGAQLHWQFQTDPGLLARTARIVTYPQYWGHRLTGTAATDVSSLGCHTDLWNPQKRQLSELATTLGIEDKMAPVRHPQDSLGPILPKIAQATGLAPDTPVSVGIHDSNASLFPHVIGNKRPMSVVSTGTWVISMALQAKGARDAIQLDPSHDTLVNVNALGEPVASARFMGGREYELIQNGHQTEPTAASIATVLDRQTMLLPAVLSDSGPFQRRDMRWRGQEPPEGSPERATALSFYLALMTATCLQLVQAEGPTIVEGPFARNAAYLAMLAAATGRPIQISNAVTGTSLGAALLFHDSAIPLHLDTPKTQHDMPKLQAYARQWFATVEA